MVTNGRKKGTMRFAVRPEKPTSRVMLAGDFNDWKPVAMRKQKDGAFVVVVALSSGSHEYKFIFDEKWRTDPDHNSWALNPYGTLNSVAMMP